MRGMFPARRASGGYILLLSILISSIMMALGFGIHTLALKELVLSTFARESSRAFANADRAMECALYWDRAFPQNGMPYTIYATSSFYQDIPPGQLNNAKCDNVAINSVWTRSAYTPNSALTTYLINDAASQTCASVAVQKTPTGTTITSNGYSTCDVTNVRRTQRTIEVYSNF